MKNMTFAHALPAETLCEWRSLWRQPGFSIPTLLFPLMFYIVFGVLLPFASTPEAKATVLVHWTVFGVIGPGLFAFGVGLANDREQGWLRLKQVSPVPVLVMLIARVAVAACFALMIVVLLFTVGALFTDVRFERAEWLSLALIAVAGVLPSCAIGFAFGAYLGTRAAVAVVNVFYLGSAMLSGLWFPLQAFPGFMQKVAWALPPFHLAELARHGAGLGSAANWPLSLAVLLCVTIIALALAIPGLRRGEQL